MFSVNLAVGSHKRAGLKFCSGIPLDKSGVISVWHKTDILAVVLFRVDKSVFLRNLPHPLLGQAAQGKKQAGKLSLRQGIEHIALVFGVIQAFFQQPSACFHILFHPGVMAGGHVIIADLPGTLHQLPKFDVPVAIDTGIGRFTPFIGPYKPVHDLLPEAVSKIEHIKGHAQPGGYAAGVVHIVQGAAGFLSGNPRVLIGMKLQGDADRFVAELLHQKRGYTGIHSAAHGYDGFFFHSAASFFYMLYVIISPCRIQFFSVPGRAFRELFSGPGYLKRRMLLCNIL